MMQHHNLFQWLGRLKQHEYDISLCEGVESKQNSPCRIPCMLRDKVKAELKSMETLGVIKHMNEPTDWAYSDQSKQSRLKGENMP